jgi:hypothetical protein
LPKGGTVIDGNLKVIKILNKTKIFKPIFLNQKRVDCYNLTGLIHSLSEID